MEFSAFKRNSTSMTRLVQLGGGWSLGKNLYNLLDFASPVVVVVAALNYRAIKMAMICYDIDFMHIQYCKHSYTSWGGA